MEFWVVASPEDLTRVRDHATGAEHLGFDGIAFGDSQNRSGDTIVALTAAAVATTRLQLGTAVVNPYTRHPAVLASAFASVQSISEGRVALGIGRGDSSLAFLGLAPAPLPYFERFLRALQGYLRGDDVPFEDLPPSVLPRAAELDLQERPQASRLRWLRADLAKVPVDVAASGPKVIALAARLADRITFAVGADAARLRWAVDLAREARAEAGLDPNELSFGAHVAIAVHDDAAEARRLGQGILSALMRLTVLHGATRLPVDERTKSGLDAVLGSYSMTAHAESASPQGAMVPDDLADAFGIYGPPEHCVERLRELAAAGIDRVNLVQPLRTSDPDGMTMRRIGEEVIPAFRPAIRTTT